MRWGCAVAALAILLGNSYYYWRFLVRHQEAARMATLVEALEAKSTKKLKPATRQYMQRLYGPDVTQARDFFFGLQPLLEKHTQALLSCGRVMVERGKNERSIEDPSPEPKISSIFFKQLQAVMVHL